MTANTNPSAQPNKVEMYCLNCDKPVQVKEGSLEHQGVFNVFCNGECEDEYAWKQ